MDKCFYCRKEEPVLLVEKLPSGRARDICPTCFAFIKGCEENRINKLRLIPPTRQVPKLLIIKNNGGTSVSGN